MRTDRQQVMFTSCALLVVCLSAAGQQEQRKQIPGSEIRLPPAKQNLPAEQVFKNIEILKGRPAAHLPEMMKALNRELGVDCEYCHVGEAWETDEALPKRTTRRMFKMVGDISRGYFEGQNVVTCWTCHRGSPKVSNGRAEISVALSSLPPGRKEVLSGLIDGLGIDKNKPARDIFQNIQILQTVPAEQVVRLMGVFAVALGAECSNCHVADQWDDDDKAEKETARRMLQMVQEINQQVFEGQQKVGCWTCHRGVAKPETAPKITSR